jgi:hypothetical protein
LLVAASEEWRRHASSAQLVMRLEDRDQLMERIRVHISDLMHMFARYGRDDVDRPALLNYVIDYRSGGMFLLLKSCASRRTCSKTATLLLHLRPAGAQHTETAAT